MPAWTRYTHRISLGIAAIGLIFVAPVLFAQEGGGPAEPQPQPAAEGEQPAAAAQTQKKSTDESIQENETIMDMVVNSGPTGLTFLGVLVLFSIVGAMVALERAVNMQRNKIMPPEFLAELKTVAQNERATAESLRNLCERKTSPVSSILSAGLLRAGRPLPEVEKSMEDAAAREMAALRGGIRPLNVVGSIAPLVGLLGTVLGMIVAFRTASQAGLGKGELMAQGIYMALLTTAAGLTIAIPCLLLAAFFNSKVERFFREIDESVMETLPCFARLEQASPAASGGSMAEPGSASAR